MNNSLDITRKLVWGLAYLSVTSCLVRNDYNVIFAFFLLIIINNFYNEDSKLFSKIIIHALSLLVMIDFIWIIFTFSLWSHQKTTTDLFWDNLQGIHSFGKLLSFVELGLKILIITYLVLNYKNKYDGQIGDLLKLNYSGSMGQVSNPGQSSPANIQARMNYKNNDLDTSQKFDNPY